MADYSQGDYAYSNEPPKGAGTTKVVNLAGAALSIALVIGLGVWGYKLAMRDVNGVPVVRALEGPTRVQPESPGGISADYQGLAVNSVQAEGAAETPADRLTLAPRPVLLTAEDQPPGTATSAAPAPEATPMAEAAETDLALPAVVQPTLLDPAQDVVLDDAEAADPVAAALAMAEKIAEGQAPLAAGTTDVAGVPDAIEAAVAMAIGGVVRSPRPKIRPDIDLAARAVAAAVAVSSDPGAANAAIAEVDANAIPAGTRLAQLGAFDTPEVARAEWDRLSGRFGDYLGGKSRVIQQAQSGGRTFYRLRAMGFDDINDARRFCSALLAENAACIPVVTR
ncbi:SPOR domain-containing protein [Pseudogemmobacter sp. W21_MBD1_M6]|uniref:SPOR domain-containing protein n=1 Tax=Pseudogemmobacter sp. W21_MBD1_M6 TaxID=3240271 RepID=UPI003F9455B0